MFFKGVLIYLELLVTESELLKDCDFLIDTDVLGVKIGSHVPIGKTPSVLVTSYYPKGELDRVDASNPLWRKENLPLNVPGN